MAALAWVYSHGYREPLTDSSAKHQTLGELSSLDRKIFDIAMEIAQLLVACTWKCFQVTMDEVEGVRVGLWLDDALALARSSGVSGRTADEGRVFLPFYIVLRAIHPLCPGFDEVQRQDVSIWEQVSVFWLEPRIYDEPCSETCTFPPASEDDKNYNLWFIHNGSQPDPFYT